MAFRVVNNDEFNQIKNNGSAGQSNGPSRTDLNGWSNYQQNQERQQATNNYLSEQNVLNDISRLATMDSQMNAQARNEGYNGLVDKFQSYAGNNSAGSSGIDIESYKASLNPNYGSVSSSAQAAASTPEAQAKAAATQRQNDEANFAAKSDEEKFYLAVQKDVDDLTKKYSDMYDEQMKKDPSLREEGRAAFIDYWKGADPVFKNAVESLPGAEKAWNEYQFNNPTEADAMASALQGARDATNFANIQDSYSNNATLGGSLDTMDYDNTYNQTHNTLTGEVSNPQKGVNNSVYGEILNLLRIPYNGN
jgi:hypothetical protein